MLKPEQQTFCFKLKNKNYMKIYKNTTLIWFNFTITFILVEIF